MTGFRFSSIIMSEGSKKEQPSTSKSKQGFSKLKVPTHSFNVSNTPTPTNLLRTLSPLGLFRDLSDETPQSAKSSSSNNPFDEHFRKALTSSNEKCSNERSNDDMLNTPQILTFPSLQDIQSAPSSARVIQVPATNTETLISSTRPIAPKFVQSACSVEGQQNDSAQLLIKMPTGKTIKLSQIPFYSHEFASAKPNNLDPIAVIEEAPAIGNRNKKPKKHLTGADDNLKARNRAAASRSRLKRKMKTENMKKQCENLLKENSSLKAENELLKNEVIELKEKLKQNASKTCVIIDSKSSLSKEHFIRLTSS